MSYQPTIATLLEDSTQFQLLMDSAVETFEQPMWANYLEDKFQLSLDWRSVLAVMEQSPLASVIDFSGKKPVYTRPTVSKLSGEIPTLGMKYQMSKREVREYLELQDKVGTLGISSTDLIDFLMPDIKRATLGPHNVLDRLFLESISTGQMSLTAANNPKGVIWNTALNWGITEKFAQTAAWSTAATATPLKDIKKVVEDWADSKGARFNMMKMSRATFNLMVATTEFKSAFTSTFTLSGLNKTELNNNQFMTVANVNQVMQSLELPTLEIIERSYFVEGKDGTRTAIKPFADNRVSFSIDNQYGQVIRTYANEDRSPIANKSYSTAMNVLLSKYKDMDGNEFTESEFNAIPVLNKANQMAILKTDSTS